MAMPDIEDWQLGSVRWKELRENPWSFRPRPRMPWQYRGAEFLVECGPRAACRPCARL